jgi:hypothetical protein
VRRLVLMRSGVAGRRLGYHLAGHSRGPKNHSPLTNMDSVREKSSTFLSGGTLADWAFPK